MQVVQRVVPVHHTWYYYYTINYMIELLPGAWYCIVPDVCRLSWTTVVNPSIYGKTYEEDTAGYLLWNYVQEASCDSWNKKCDVASTKN
jgi:hypothetical protein